jgi:mRNA-degrading endonuclease RelE of RelBE toxin-antitoxin system
VPVPAYELQLAASAERALARLPDPAAAAVVEFITGPLLENPQRVGKSLVLELEGYWSARRGAYRVIYRIADHSIVHVVRIDHRADVYRRR